jgi:hypothetical protein
MTNSHKDPLTRWREANKRSGNPLAGLFDVMINQREPHHLDIENFNRPISVVPMPPAPPKSENK